MKNKKYNIRRFYAKGTSKLIKSGVSLQEAQEHCRREDTHKEGDWFDGYTACCKNCGKELKETKMV